MIFVEIQRRVAGFQVLPPEVDNDASFPGTTIGTVAACRPEVSWISVGRGTYFQVQVLTKFLGRKKIDPYAGNMQADLEFQMFFSSDFHIFRMVTFWDGSIECNTPGRAFETWLEYQLRPRFIPWLECRITHPRLSWKKKQYVCQMCSYWRSLSIFYCTRHGNPV